MAPYKKDLTALTKGGAIHKHVGKGSVQQRVPAGGMQTITPGNPAARTLQDYSKATPMPMPNPSPMGPPGMGGPPDMGM